MSKKQRWENAQNGEEKYFNTVYMKSSLYLTDTKRVRALAKFVIDTIETINNGRLISPKVLEVGSGPIGLIWGFPFSDLYGVDPLDDKYKNEPNVSRIRKEGNVNYKNAKAENLPFADEYFDCIICHNVLDHVDDWQNAIAEMIRCVKDDGIIYLNVNCHNWFYKYTKNTLQKCGIFLEKHHPFCFTRHDVLLIVKSFNLKIRYSKYESMKFSGSCFNDVIKSFIRKFAGKGYIALFLSK